MILCPRLKQHIGVDKLKVTIPSGELEVYTEPPVRFIADCAPTPFEKPNLLIAAMEGLKKNNVELTPLPRDEFRRITNRYLRCHELLERLGAYAELSNKYGECVIKFEAAQLLLDTDQRHMEELNQELLMNRISNILDRIINTLLKDNALRKKKKKVTYPLPKINPRSATFTSMDQVQEMKKALQDELVSILQVAFIPEEEMGGAFAIIEGEDIPDDTGRHREGRRGPNQNAATNTRAPKRSQSTVNFEDREQHRRTTINEVQQTLQNLAANNDRVKNTNIHSERQELPSGRETTNAIEATTPVLPVTQTQQVTGMETGLNKNAPHVEIKATTRQAAKQKEEDNSGVADVGRPHTAMPHVPYSAVPVH